MEDQCDKCVFFLAHTDEGKFLHRPGNVCQRFPKEEDKNPQDWCGEFKKEVTK
jgi:hypothetical protein